ncbi:hypothetical protein QOZ88_05835 [Blastococcus sp. BMG 814]|uniref:4Fe-4S Wbl-type domain-containing protein n=1 Tax=Blastococcus carthaginiensis TaxID=3050034 RepID=A0ABT9I9A0_9ACTN|nr:hypothetical protein [Blastococcus carthaginiensis]MDP5182150.1 hypothetical protein [Blastococcus carthaginiensis]
MPLPVHTSKGPTDLLACDICMAPWPCATTRKIERVMLPTVERIATERAAEAWDAGYSAAQLDADEQPYSDRPERKTWQRRQNPHRASALRAATSQQETT